MTPMAPAGLPLQQIKTMKSQGVDNNQIIQALQKDGYSSSQIFDAMNQVSIEQYNPSMSGQSLSGTTTGSATPMDSYPQRPYQPPMPPQPPASGTSVEETVEAIIDEKWNELVKDITTIIEWKNQAQNTIIGMEQQFRDLKEQFDKLHQALIAKIGEYDKNILDVGAEVKAMERVFSKVLPVFTENVAELSEITKRMKGQ